MDPVDFEDLLRQQNMMFRSVALENETDNKIRLMDIINSLVTDKNRKVQRAVVILEAENHGLSEDESQRLLELMKIDGMIIEPEPGYIKRA
jgi:DNA replicative helicase MCM subunit Mcm2 (Cdc46/Mcm family)